MINVTALKKKLKEGEPSGLYLFYGEEKYLVDMYIKKITDMAVGDAFSEFNISVYDEDNESFAAFCDDVNSYPTMSKKKAVVLKNVKFTKLKEFQKPLADILNELPDYVVLIIAEEELSRIKKPVIDVISKNVEIVEFKKQSVSDLRAWVTRQLSLGGKKMDIKTTEHLINLCERSLDRLSTECAKLVSATEDEIIDFDMVNSMVKVPIEYKIFEMADKLLENDVDSVYKIIEGFKISKVQPIVILSVIYGQLNDIYMYGLVGDEGKNGAEFLAANKKWMSGRLATASKKYDRDRLRKGMALCAEYDLKIKTGSLEGYTAIELIAAELTKIK